MDTFDVPPAFQVLSDRLQIIFEFTPETQLISTVSCRFGFLGLVLVFLFAFVLILRLSFDCLSIVSRLSFDCLAIVLRLSRDCLT